MSAELTSLVPSMLAALPGMLDVSMLLAIAALGCFAGGLAAFVATRRTLHRIAWRLARFEQLANSTSMDLKTLLREGERFDEIARELHAAIAALGERHDQLELRASGGTAWEHAIDLARMGLSPDQLMSSVGVTRGEAELLAHLHRNDPDVH
jgi:hypothetical protein